MPGHRFFAPPEQFSTEFVTLSQAESHHGLAVIRLHVGDRVFVVDGCGVEYKAEVADIRRKEIVLRLGEQFTDIRESPLDLTLAAALIKMDRFEWMIQKAVELGVNKLIPL